MTVDGSRVFSQQSTTLMWNNLFFGVPLSFKAEALVVATGFDTFKSDPLGCFALESNSYYKIGRMIRCLNLPTLFVQEGGYFVEALRENARQLVKGFENV
ncbi:hypothetical protein [Nostoc sphaeroides]|nr:hypothetical protein [Nostoc sphaeroides]